MIDTIRFKLSPCSWVALSDVPAEWDILDGERVSRKYNKTEKRQNLSVDSGRMLVHRDTGLRVCGSGLCPDWLEVSLPRVYHGRNGVLIENDVQIMEAFQALEKLVLQVVVLPVSTIADRAMSVSRVNVSAWEMNPFPVFEKVTRLDLVWQFRGEVATWIQAFRYNKHPNVRRPTVTHDGSGLVFPGVGCHIRIYDKRKEVYRRPGDVVRVECQLRGSKLKELGLTVFSYTGGFSRLWSTYKDFILKFNPDTLREVGCIADLLAVLEAENVKVGTQTPFEIWAAGKHRSTVSRMKSAMKETLPKLCGVDLWELLAVPVAINLEVES